MALRGEVWWVKLDPTVGHEIQKTRPCLIVSPNEMNRHGTAIVLPLTTGPRRRFRIPTSVSGKTGAAAADQIRTIDHARLGRRVGAIDQAVLTQILAVLRQMFED